MAEPTPPDPNHLVAGHYVLGDEIHAGGMAYVYRSRDRETEQLVALKRPAKADPATLARFAEEGKILSQLDHPAIVRLLAHGCDTFEDAHIVMEWLEGETLSARLDSGPLSMLDAVTVARRAAEALSAVHRAKITHRDLKPANLILSQSSPAQAKLIDFGIARRESARGLNVHASFSGGTWAYMSPEQAMGSAELGARADIYALGCVLFEAISGEPAFPSDRAQAVVAKVWHPPPKLEDYCADVPGPLLTLIAKMLATDPLRRQRDGGALVSELLALGKMPDRIALRKA
jgi:eukaryotic-like serine/threonine-protein kinase